MILPAYPVNAASFPEMYERWLAIPLFRPGAEIALDRVRPLAGESILDVACGTGIGARVARERLGANATIVGVDVSPQMLAVARTAAPDIEWREGNATALPFGDFDAFDVAVCLQGFQFLADRGTAARELRRVLKPGGRVAVTTWRPLEEVPLFQALHGVAERHLGRVVDRRHAFGDGKALHALLRDAGFSSIRVETVTHPTHISDAAVFMHLNALAIVGMSAAAAAMGSEQRAQMAALIANDSVEALAPFSNGSGLAFDIGMNMATARR